MKKKIPTRPVKPRIPYTPRLSGAFEGKIYNVVKATFPKLRFKGLEFDDLLQEAALVFLLCRDRYAGKVDNPAWFMSLFSRALHWHFIDLQRTNFPYISMEEAGWQEPVTDFDAGFGLRVLRELPADMQELLAALFVDDAAFPALQSRFRSLGGGTDQILETKEV